MANYIAVALVRGRFTREGCVRHSGLRRRYVKGRQRKKTSSIGSGVVLLDMSLNERIPRAKLAVQKWWVSKTTHWTCARLVQVSRWVVWIDLCPISVSVYHISPGVQYGPSAKVWRLDV